MASHNSGHNLPPEIEHEPDIVAPEKALIQIEINATDPNGDNLIMEAVQLPAGAQFQQNATEPGPLYKGYIKWIPTYDQAGSHAVTIKVRDEYATDFETFYINVTNVNRAPYLDIIRNDWIDELEQLAFTKVAYDPDGDDLTYSLVAVPTDVHNDTVLPEGVQFADGANDRASFAWTPNCLQGLPENPLDGGGARYQFKMSVTDGALSHARQFNVTVYHVDTTPELDVQDLRFAIEGTSLTFNITGDACDPEAHFLEVGLVAAQPTGYDAPALPSPLPSTELPDGVTVVPEEHDYGRWAPNETGNLTFYPHWYDTPMLYNNITQKNYSVFNWAIGFQQQGKYTFYAKMFDNQSNTDEIHFEIRISDFNTAPVLDGLPAFHDGTGAYYAKEDTRFNMTGPLGWYGAEYPDPARQPILAQPCTPGNETWCSSETIGIDHTANWTNTAQRFDCWFTPETITWTETIINNITNETAMVPSLSHPFVEQVPCGDTLAFPQRNDTVTTDAITSYNSTQFIANVSYTKTVTTLGAELIPEACIADQLNYTCVDAGLVDYPTGTTCDWAQNISWPIPCGTPWVAHVQDAENDTIFWNLDWLQKDGKTVSGDILPKGLRFIAPGTNWTTGQSNNATTYRTDIIDGVWYNHTAVSANESFAMIRWIPDYAQAGTYTFRMWATDGVDLSESIFTIKVENTNRRPVLPDFQEFVVLEGEEIKLDLEGTDRDFSDVKAELRDDLVFSAAGLPAGSQWQTARDEAGDKFHGAFRWVPGYHQAGNYTVTLHADDSDDRRLFPDNILGYGSDIFVGSLYLEAPFNFPTPRLGTEFNETTSFKVRVLDVDRPPVIDEIPDVTYQHNATVNLLVNGYDPDGDTLRVNITGLPLDLGFVNETASPDILDGRIFGTAVQGGVHYVTVEICSGFPALCATEEFTIIIIVDTDFELGVKGIQETSPNTDLVIPVSVENTGPADPDTIVFSVALSDGTLVNYTSSVTLNSTASGWANLTVNLPYGVAKADLTITATSVVDPGFTKVAKVQVRVPLDIQVVLTDTTPGSIEGVALVTFADGSPLVAHPATATQSPRGPNPFGQFTTSQSGFTVSSGEFGFKFGAADKGASLPGQHDLVVSLTYGGQAYSASTTYTPGV